MGNQIIKQPNGKFAIWSTVVDDFTWMDCTLRQLHMIYGANAYEEARSHVDAIVEKLENGEKPYYQFTMTWEEAQEELAEKTETPDEPEDVG